MRRLIVLGAVVAACVGCGSKTTIPPGSRLIMQGNVPLWTVCDRGNRLYVTEKGMMQLVPMGCVDGQP